MEYEMEYLMEYFIIPKIPIILMEYSNHINGI